jgi:hypothetical protein
MGKTTHHNKVPLPKKKNYISPARERERERERERVTSMPEEADSTEHQHTD